MNAVYPLSEYYDKYSRLKADVGDVVSWNDNPARTHAEVYETLKRLDI